MAGDWDGDLIRCGEEGEGEIDRGRKLFIIRKLGKWNN